MHCTCIRYSELPGTSRLFADFLYRPEGLERFYLHLPHQPEAFRQAAARAAGIAPEHRASLVAALRQLNGDLPSLDLLAREGTVAVVTGQQVGLFSGPAYTIYKALTAVRLAERLTEHGIPAVPVFWLATEDHDFAEVNHAWAFDPEGRPRKFEVNGAVATNQPVGEVRLRDVPDTREILASFPYGEEVAGLIQAAYQPGQTVGQAFSTLLRSFLGQRQLIHVDPMRPEVRALAAPAIRKALEAAPDLTEALLQRNRELASAGYHAQVHVEPHTSLVFLLENGRRMALRRTEAVYQLNGRLVSTAELMDRAEHLSPNALLRPVVQDSILPTAAYVGGPAELAYLAQSEVIYSSVLGHMPVPVHRAGFTLLDARGAKLMQRYGLSLTDVLHAEGELRERIGRRLVPPTLAHTLDRTRAAVADSLDALDRELAVFDPTLAASLAKSRGKIQYQISKMERKASREMLLHDARAAGHAAYLHRLLFPEKHLQERLYSIFPFLARHGLGLVHQLYENVHLDCPDHELLVV
jgi:bacillithiol biosynthesis cysteine-adding enzyme BshC